MNVDHFVDRVVNWIDEGEVVRAGLAYEGPRLIRRLTRDISLRKVARRTGLSATYLSLVANGRAVISPKAFLKLAKRLNDVGKFE